MKRVLESSGDSRASAGQQLYAYLAGQLGLAASANGLDYAQTDPLPGWARSGLALLTGDADSHPVIPRRDYAGRLDAVIAVTKAFAALGGRSITLDHRVFTERAAELGLHRRGRWSCNGAARLLRARDGWMTVNLARQDDVDMVPAWIGCECAGDAWAAIERQATARLTTDFVSAGQLLGIPVSAVNQDGDEQWSARWTSGRRAARIARMTQPSGVRTGPWAERRPLVVDLSSLWAGPLCGHVLSLAGARVIKVESLRRPDAARFGPRRFFDRLHAGQESLVVDFAAAEGRSRLARLLAAADVVIEGSRPRAMEQLGVDVEAAFRANRALVWVSLTAYGRTGPWLNRVGFGDDTAAAGGLVADDEGGAPVFVGDALADPIAGLTAAAAAMAALYAGGGVLVDVALREAAAFVANADLIEGRAQARIIGREGRWRLRADGIDTPLAPPAERPTNDLVAPVAESL